MRMRTVQWQPRTDARAVQRACSFDIRHKTSALLNDNRALKHAMYFSFEEARRYGDARCLRSGPFRLIRGILPTKLS
jgi:hypothetical protein